MKITFFEEFPTKENLDKLKLLDFKTTVFLTAKTYEEFKKIELPEGHEKAFWPITKEHEGYWLSPFVKKRVLTRVMKEIEKCPNKVLWDAELPRNKFLMFTELIWFRDHCNYINKFLKNQGPKIYTAEYMPIKGIVKNLMENFCLTFSPKKYKNTMVKMLYTSMHNFGRKFVEDEIKTGVDAFGDKFSVGLGTIAIGKIGTEPVLKPELLERDLSICQKYGVSEAIIFRLGGLNKEYAKILKKYQG